MVFSQDFARATALKQKRKILKEYFVQNPNAKLGSFVDSLSGKQAAGQLIGLRESCI